ncbi:MAG: hypothetical protein LBE85_02555 [Candidatus Accumulibacter sp.]|jgi:hypothetical protein|nr:hypothetical protein [Accumulibacter sp.]
MFKRKRIDLSTAQKAMHAFEAIPIRYVDVNFSHSLKLAHDFKLYAYDAYFSGLRLAARCAPGLPGLGVACGGKRIRHRSQGDFAMTVFTYSETRQRLAAVLDFAKRKGEALIQRKDGSLFRLVPVAPAEPPLDIEGIDGGVFSHEILAAVRESRSARKFK